MSYNTLAGSGLSGYSGKTDPEVQAALDNGELYLDAVYARSYPGVIADSAQANLWPRMAFDGSGLTIAERTVAITDIPVQVLQAEIEAAKLILDGRSLLPTTVADATSASTQNRELIEDTVEASGDRVTQKWSPSGTSTSTNSVQTLTDIGLPKIGLLDALMAPIVAAGSGNNSANYYFLRA